MHALRTLSCSVILVSASLLAQTLVSTAPLPRTALLEKFTAMNCGNCPAAANVTADLDATHGDDLVLINVHGGALANPGNGQPDFRTTDGTALWSQFGVGFQPQGIVNRQMPQQASGWAASVGSVLAQTSPVNIGVASGYDGGTALLTVQVELYYTSDGPSSEDRIHVAVTQDHIIGWQADYVNGNQADYDHRHVLRDIITPLAGDPVPATTIGTLVQRTYTLTLPAAWNVDDLHVVAFVSEADGAVQQVRSVRANGGMTVGVGESADRFLGLGAAYPVPATDRITIPLAADAAAGILVVRDGTGRLVHQQRVPSGTPLVVLPVTGLAEGVYTYGFSNGAARPVVVAR